MKKTIFLLFTLTFFSPLFSQEEESKGPSVFEALEMLIQKASQKTDSETDQQVAETTNVESEENYEAEDPLLSVDGVEV